MARRMMADYRVKNEVCSITPFPADGRRSAVAREYFCCGGERKELSGDAFAQFFGAGIETVRPADTIPEKCVAGNKESSLLIIEANRALGMAGTVDDFPRGSGKGLSLLEQEIGFGNSRPQLIEKIRGSHVPKEPPVLRFSSGAEVGGIVLVDGDRDLVSARREIGHEGANAANVIEVPMTAHDEGWNEPPRVEKGKDTIGFRSGIDEDA